MTLESILFPLFIFCCCSGWNLDATSTNQPNHKRIMLRTTRTLFPFPVIIVVLLVWSLSSTVDSANALPILQQETSRQQRRYNRETLSSFGNNKNENENESEIAAVTASSTEGGEREELPIHFQHRSSQPSNFTNIQQSKRNLPQESLKYQKQSMLRRISPSTAKRVMILSFIGISGAVEAFFIRYYKAFPNLLTGHTVKGLYSLVEEEWITASLHLSIVSAYCIGVGLYKYLELQQQQEHEDDDETTKATTKIVSQTLLKIASKWCVILFGLSDIIHYLFLQPHHGLFAQWRMPCLAIGFGFINAASTQILQTITNAATGHWTKLSMGFIDTWTTKRRQHQRQQLLSKYPSSSPSSWSLSAWAIITFGLSLISTSLLFRILETYHWMGWQRRLPPMGLLLGVVYATLLTGYSQYLQEQEQQKQQK